MKKMLRKVAAAVAAVAMISAFASCNGDAGTDDDEDDDEEISYTWTQLSEKLGAGVELETVEGFPLSINYEVAPTAALIPGDIVKRLQVGSVVYFEVTEFKAEGKDSYLEVSATNGNWLSCGVTEYRKAKDDEKLDVVRWVNNDGVFVGNKIKPAAGIYYFTVTEENLASIKSGIGFQGNATIKKVAVKNLAEAVVNNFKGSVISGDVATFNVIEDATSAEYSTVILEIERTSESEDYELNLKDLDLEVKINDVAVVMPNKASVAIASYDGNITGTEVPAKYRAKLSLGQKLSTGDVVTVQLKSAKVSSCGDSIDEDSVKAKLFIILIDNDPNAGYWHEIVANGENNKPAVTTVVAPVEGEEEEEQRPAVGTVVYTATGDALTIAVNQNIYGTPAVSHGVQATFDGEAYLPAGALAGETYKIVMKGTADAAFTANVQFLTADWGGYGEAIVANFTAEAFEISGYYTFNKDTATGFRFVIGNEDPECLSKTLSLTEFTITRENAAN